MRVSVIFALLLVLAPLDAAFAQLAGTGDFHIVWEVKNRFRLFRNEADFLRLAAASRGDGVLAAERRLERATDGLGWAKDVVGNLCLDISGELVDSCERDGVRENYLAPSDHPIGVTISGPAPQGAACVWSFDSGNGPLKQSTAPCDQEVKLRVPYGRTTVATVDIPLGDGTAQRVVTEIAVRDILIAGLGDSIAAGEGNPDQAVQLEGGFCFKRFLRGGGSQYFRPSRAGYDRRPVLRKRAVEPGGGKRLGPPWRAMDESGLPSFALQLPGAHRARSGDRAAAHCRDARSARLHRGGDRQRHVRQPARRRLSMGRGS